MLISKWLAQIRTLCGPLVHVRSLAVGRADHALSGPGAACGDLSTPPGCGPIAVRLAVQPAARASAARGITFMG